MLNKKYIFKNILSNEESRGFTYINPLIIDIPLKNVNSIKFGDLYPIILSGLVEEGYHEIANDKIKNSLIDYRKKVDFFINNKKELKSNPNKYKELKKEINSFFGRLSYFNIIEETPNYPLMVTKYMEKYYKDLLNVNKDKILYIDTDIVFYFGEIDILDIDIKYISKKIKYFLAKGEKKYLTFEDDYFLRGLENNDAKEAINLIKNFIRNDKIEELGIYGF
jgi:hypothetical protein